VPKRLVGELTVVLPDGYVERCIIKERGEKRYLERLKENLEIILKNSPKENGNIKINYSGPYAAGIYDFLKSREKEIDAELQRQ